ncbi:BON domain-containing protein [Massilia sp. CF038]|uniref:BON domain-containing protein n=1 Tax=Massilia sp. CF038 TaxID=1881045 RepID=UPI00090ED070|nr:BON domain-containing protein [Massilia sp. CF038]SHG41977.1 BON domain-containing protein [Massilia sp. CF038]
MKPFVATLLASALTAAFASAYAADTKPDNATYRTMTAKASADYKQASAQCTGMSGNERAVCIEEAKVARARTNADAVAQYNNTLKARTAARNTLANAEYALAKVKCSVSTGAEKDSCLANAQSVHVAALADAKADRDTRVASTTGATAGVDDKGLVANTNTTDPAKAAAVDKCAQVAGQPSIGCLINNKDNTVAATTAGTASTVAANTREAAGNVAQKTENLAERAVDKTKEVASNIANKTERAVDRVADRTDNAGERTANATENATAKTGKVVADSVITTKVKADLFKEPELSAMGIHVETEKGVVMLSGFVDSKADADKAVRLAKSVEGVSQVKSAIKVK